jgi:hypothetical protein
MPALSLPPLLGTPVDMAVNTTEIYLAIQADRRLKLESTSHVCVLDHEGNFLRLWGTSGRGRGEFCYISGIALADKVVYVSSSNRIQAFRQDGSFLWIFEGTALTAGLVATPNELFVLCSEGMCALSNQGVVRFKTNFPLAIPLGVLDHELLCTDRCGNFVSADVRDGTLLRSVVGPGGALGLFPEGFIVCEEPQGGSCAPFMSPDGFIVCEEPKGGSCATFLAPDFRSPQTARPANLPWRSGCFENIVPRVRFTTTKRFVLGGPARHPILLVEDVPG